MLSKPICAKVISALALAILMAWAGHASALFMGSSQPTLGTNAVVHSDANGVVTCAACASHYHSPLAADHVHETPHLPALLSISPQPERALLTREKGYWIPARPIFLIERPPRPAFLL